MKPTPAYRILRSAAFATASIVLAFPAGAQTLRRTVNDPDSELDNFGSALTTRRPAVNHEEIFVGSPNWYDPIALQATGAVHVYEDDGQNTPTLTRTILPPSAYGAYSLFGSSVAGDGADILLVGAPNATEGSVDQAGTAFVYDLSQPDPLQPAHRLVNPDAFSLTDFGKSLAAGAGVYFVGARRQTVDAHPNAGAVQVYDSSGTWLRTLVSPAPINSEFFGGSIAVIGTQVYISASGYAPPGEYGRGAVYVFNANINDESFGAFVTRIDRPTPSYPYSFYYFGYAIASWSHYLLVSDNQGPEVFLLDVDSPGTAPLLTLRSPDPIGVYSHFGESLAYNGKKIVVGAPYSSTGVSSVDGAVYVFDGDLSGTHAGMLVAKIDNPAVPTDGDLFGSPVALSPLNEDILIGAPNENGGRGAFYIYTPPPAVTDIVFGVNRGMSNFNVSIELQGSVAGFQPDIFGTVTASVISNQGRLSGFQITDVDLRADDLTVDAPFHFESSGVGVVLGGGRGVPGPTVFPDGLGNFNQAGNLVEFDGAFSGTIGSTTYTANGGAGSGQLPVNFPGNIVPNGGGFDLRLPFNIVRTVQNPNGDDPTITGSGTLILTDASTLPTPTPSPSPSPTPGPGMDVKPYLLGESADPTGLDHNADNVIDISDLIYGLTHS